MFSIYLVFVKSDLNMQLIPPLLCSYFSFFPSLELEPRASHTLGKCSTTGLYPQPSSILLMGANDALQVSSTRLFRPQNHRDNEHRCYCFLNCILVSFRTTTRKTIFCMWPTVTKVSMGNEAEAQQMGAPGLGGRGGVLVGLGEPEGGLPTMEETQGEDIGKHHTAHTVFCFFTSSIVSFLCFLSPGRSCVGLTVRAGWVLCYSQLCSEFSCSFIRRLGGGQVATREEYSSAATPVSLGRGLIFGICTKCQNLHIGKGGKCFRSCRGPYLRDQKIPTVIEAL